MFLYLLWHILHNWQFRSFRRENFQTLAHLSSGSVFAVNARFTGFMIQYGCFLYLLWHILHNWQFRSF
ncbi:hypothetical protein LEP1GSC057_3931 [Leptospira interrogans str. Brem 329]|nr:hypothetical protein LEP1GSC057_3931 [Leptospira interrogans str. Brem 329]